MTSGEWALAILGGATGAMLGKAVLTGELVWFLGACCLMGVVTGIIFVRNA